MRKTIAFAIALGFAGMTLTRATAQQPPATTPNPDSQYRLGPDSLPQEGVPKGEIRGPFTLPSEVYSGHPAHLLGLRPGAVRPGRAGGPDGLPGRPGIQG